MAQLRPSILYILLAFGGILFGLGLIYGLFYDSEKFEGNRYKNSYEVFSNATLTEKQKTAITALQEKGIEWAHFRFIEAIKVNDLDLVTAFIDAGMPLNSNTILLEIALSTSAEADKKLMLALLQQHYQLDLNALYRLPNYVSAFDKQLAAIFAPYAQLKKEQYRLATMAYKKAFVEWEKKLEEKKQQVLKVCTNDACRSGRINDVRRMFADFQPQEPQLNYISIERVNVSLHTLFAWQKDLSLMSFIIAQERELIPNKLFLTDGKLIYFTVDVNGNSSIINTKH